MCRPDLPGTRDTQAQGRTRALRRSWRACVRTAAPVFASAWVFGFGELAGGGSTSSAQTDMHIYKAFYDHCYILTDVDTLNATEPKEMYITDLKELKKAVK